MVTPPNNASMRTIDAAHERSAPPEGPGYATWRVDSRLASHRYPAIGMLPKGSAVAPGGSILAPVDPEVTRGLSRASACHTTLYRGRGRGGEPSWKQGADMTLYFVNYEIVHGIVH